MVKRFIAFLFVAISATIAYSQSSAVSDIAESQKVERHSMEYSWKQNINGDSLNIGGDTKTWYSDWFVSSNKYITGAGFVSFHGYDWIGFGDSDTLSLFYAGCYVQFAMWSPDIVHKHNAADTLFWFKDTTAETDIVTNGTFSADASWQKDTGWSISTGVASHTGALTNSIYQSCLTIGKYYTIAYTVSAYASDSIKVYCGDTIGTKRTANGTYTERLLCTANVKLAFLANKVLSIDNVSAREDPRSIVQNDYLAYEISSVDTLQTGGKKPYNAIRLAFVYPDSAYCATLGLIRQAAKNATIEAVIVLSDSTR